MGIMFKREFHYAIYPDGTYYKKTFGYLPNE